jgi:sulfur carrier protein ThiS adenylyltransferase
VKYSRQKNIVPRDLLPDKVSVIGVGAIGRQLCINLSAMGVRKLLFYDYDIVEPQNCVTQGYRESYLGGYKTDALRDELIYINRDTEYCGVCDRFRRKYIPDMGKCIFCCVDSIEIRKLIWECAKGNVDFFCDGRMLAEYIRVLAIGSAEDEPHYEASLHPKEETIQGSCTSEGVIYGAAIAAGMMSHQFTRWLRGHAVNREVMLNLPAGEMTVVEGSGSRHTGIIPPPQVPAETAQNPEGLVQSPEDDEDEDDDEGHDEWGDPDDYDDEYEEEDEGENEDEGGPF